MAGVRQFDEGETLTRALEVFWRKGLHATSMQELAEATGVQRGSLYNAYGDKDTLFLMAYQRYAAGHLAELRATLASSDVRAALVAFFDVAVKRITSGDPSRGCLSTKTAIGAELDNAPVRQAVRDMLDGMQADLLAALSQDAARARLRVSPEQAADMMVTFTRGMAVMERVYGDPAALRTSAAALVAALVVDDM
jgi:AcrR family transcriptional regulator